MINSDLLAEIKTLAPALTGLSPRGIRQFAAASDLRELSMDEPWLAAGEQPSGVPLVVRGLLGLSCGAVPRTILVRQLRPGDLCGATIAAVFGEQRSQFTLTSHGDALIVVIPDHVVRDLHAKEPRFRAIVLAALLAEVGQLGGVIQCLAAPRLEQRVARTLLALGEETPIGRGSLSERLGCSREALSRTLSRLARRRAVRLERSGVEITDANMLASIERGRYVTFY